MQHRDDISDKTGHDLEAGHPVGYSVILSQLQTVTKVHCSQCSVILEGLKCLNKGSLKVSLEVALEASLDASLEAALEAISD